MHALIIVDVQNDFGDNGALPVKGGNEVAANISEYLRQHPNKYDKIILTRDWHRSDTDNGGHFATEPDYKKTWPAHCVGGTFGAQYIGALTIEGASHALNPSAIEIFKGQDRPAYSAFEGETAKGEHLEDLLHFADRIDVCGLAYDFCVRSTAIDAAKLTLAIVTVLADLTASVSRNSEIAATVALTEAQVDIDLALVP